MTQPSASGIDFDGVLPELSNPQVWEYETGEKGTCQDAANQLLKTLQSPLDFPPIESAIVAGDRAAIAVDANTPSIGDIVDGAIEALKRAGAGAIDVVLSDEATPKTVGEVERIAGDRATVRRHDPSDRESLRYLGADQSADPIYVNRWLVDADFVLPVVAQRAIDSTASCDITGVFPDFSDSRSRQRFIDSARQIPSQSDDVTSETATSPFDCNEPAWLLGIQLMVAVAANKQGLASRVVSGTPDAIGKSAKTTRRSPDEFPPPAPLVIASIDGNEQQQSWTNAARAAAAATRFANERGTIVVWTAIDHAPEAALDSAAQPETTPSAADEDEFPLWNFEPDAVSMLQRINQEYRLLIRCRIESEQIESIGLGAIKTVDELSKLSTSFDSCGVVRAAQFAGPLLMEPAN